MSSFRASTSRSYVVPLIVTVIARCDQLALMRPPRAWATARTASTSARCVRYSLDACTSDGRLELRVAHRGAHGVLVGRRRREHDRHGVDAAERDAHAAVQQAAAFAMHVPSTPSVTAAKPSLLPGRDRDLRQQLARRRRRSCRRRGRSRPQDTVRSPSAPAIVNSRAERRHERRQVVRRVVRADVAADRAAVAHLHVGDLGADLAEDRPRPRLARGHDLACRSSSRRSRASRRQPSSMPFSSSSPSGRRARRASRRAPS